MEQNFTNKRAPTLVANYDASISSSTAITLNSATTYIEVTAIDKAILLKWDATASTSAFDEIIPANSTRTYYSKGKTTANFIEVAATAILIVLEK
jgi:hypothetical protein